MKKFILLFSAAIFISSCVYTSEIVESDNHVLTFDELFEAAFNEDKNDTTFISMIPECTVGTMEDLLLDIASLKQCTNYLDYIEDWSNNLDEEKIRYFNETGCTSKEYKWRVKDQLRKIDRRLSDIESTWSKKYMVEDYHIPQNILNVLVNYSKGQQTRISDLKFKLRRKFEDDTFLMY